MENLVTYERAFTDRYEKQISCELVLPEYLPGISRIIRATATPYVEKIECHDGMEVIGRIAVSILYASDHSDMLKCALFNCDFKHTFASVLPATDTAMDFFCECNVTSLEEEAKIKDSRRILFSCNLALDACAYSARAAQFYNVEENDSIRKRTVGTSNLRMIPVSVPEVRIAGSVSCPEGMPMIKEMVSCTGELNILSTQGTDNGIRVKGELCVNCMYLCDEDEENNGYVTFPGAVPFEAMIDVPEGLSEVDVILRPYTVRINAEATENSYGDRNTCRIEAVGQIKGRIYGNIPLEVCCDVFSIRNDCTPDIKELPKDTLKDVLSSEREITQNIRMDIGNAEMVTTSLVEVCDSRSEISDGTVSVYCTVILRLCTSTSTGQLSSKSAKFNVRLCHDKKVTDTSHKPRIETVAYAKSPECRIENGEVICVFTLGAKSAVILEDRVQAVVGLEIDDSCEYKCDKSRYILYYPDKSEGVWSIAKRFKASPEEIARVNGITNTERVGKHCVIIPR